MILYNNNEPLFAIYYGFTYSHPIWIILNISIWPIDGILIGTTTPGQSEPGSNSNKTVLHALRSSRTGATLPDIVLCHTQDTPFLEQGGSHWRCWRRVLNHNVRAFIVRKRMNCLFLIVFLFVTFLHLF